MASPGVCLRCLVRRSAPLLTSPAPRTLSTSTTLHRASTPKPTSSTATTSSTPQRTVPAATSTSAAQPFSAGTLPKSGPLEQGETVIPSSAASPADIDASDPTTRPAPAPTRVQRPRAVVSSVPAGTVLKGLNFFKNREDPVALADDEYPDWLWTVLQRKEPTGKNIKEEVDPKLFANSPQQRRSARRRLRARRLANPIMVKAEVPVHEQSIDLPSGNAKQSKDARKEVTVAMRSKRRGDIKDRNFIQEMR